MTSKINSLVHCHRPVIRAESFFARSDGTTGAIGELIFQTDRVNTVYRGERGIAGYDALPSVAGDQRRQVNAKGYERDKLLCKHG